MGVLATTRTPFAVKGGGYATNQGFSSTTGVQIAMTRFSEIKVNAAAGTVELGAGVTSDQVYKTLEPHGITVMAGRVPGVGIAGFTLGGGERLSSLGALSGCESQITSQVMAGRATNMASLLTMWSSMNSSCRTGLSNL